MLNNDEKTLLTYVAGGNMPKAQEFARKIIDKELKFPTERELRDLLISKLDEQAANNNGLVDLEDVSYFPTEKFLIRESEQAIVDRMLATRKAAGRLQELNVSYTPSLILYGESGTGKTQLAKYMAYKMGLPYMYVKFSVLVNKYLGATQSNIVEVFRKAKQEACLLCFDEIDAVGLKRGDTANEVGEMARICISLMQELDNLPNSTVVVATTNRFDRLDPALIRRFSFSHEVLPLSTSDADRLCRQYFSYAKIDFSDWYSEWFQNTIEKCTEQLTCAKVVNLATRKMVELFSI